jgi:PAS domain S-box-containing protein
MTLLKNIKKIEIKDSAELSEWRNWLADAMFYCGIILIPFSMLFTVPTFINEKQYALLAIDISVCFVFLLRILIRSRNYRIWGACWLCILYVMTLSFFIKLGPHYARSAWLVMNTVIAALFFGTRGSLITSLLNPVILFGCYFFILPEDSTWIQVHQEPFLKYLSFVLNTASIALVSSLLVGFLLDRLEISYQKQKQINKKLNDSEKRYRLIAQNVADVIWTVDMDLNFQYISPSVYAMQGYTAQEVMEKNVTELILPESFEKILNLYNQKIEWLKLNSDKAWEPIVFEAEQYKKDGSTIWTSIHARIIPETETSPMHILGITRDITETRQARELMIQSEKMMSVGGLAAGMAHEINNPLAGMIQSANVLSNRLSDRTMPANKKAAAAANTTMESVHQFMESRDIPRMLNAITDSGIRIASIVENMLNFARKSDASFSTHDPAVLVEKVLMLASTDYNFKKKFDFKSIDIEKKYEDNLPMLVCRESEIQQVLLNIFNNGAHAMFEKKVLEKDYQPRFCLKLSQEIDLKMLRMEIQDNGPGIDKETRKRIFEPFFTTKPVGIGTGLGLSVSYFIITVNHMGTMEVESELGKSTNFIIRLPLEKDSKRK